MNPKLLTHISLSLTISLFVAACGGGSGSGDKNDRNQPTILNGQLSNLSGISYRTESHTGTTDNEGNFSYLDGETIHFFIGETSLGRSSGQQNITTFDLIEGAIIVTGNKAIEAELNNTIPPFESRPFHEVINLNILLQTLDDDGIPENGISITPAVANLFNNVELDFKQHFGIFIHSSDFRSILNRANEEGLLTEHRQVRKVWQVMDHLYGKLNIERPLALARLQRNDSEGLPTFIRVQNFNNTGTKEYWSQDDNGDGTPNNINTYFYDANSNIIFSRSEKDENDDDIIDLVTIFDYEYDLDGNRTQAINPDVAYVNKYDETGKITRSDQLEASNISPPNYSPVAYRNFSYDSNGNPSQEVAGNSLNGTIDLILSREFDDYNNVTRIKYNREGVITIKSIVYHDNEIQYLIDEEGDDIIDEISISRFNEQGLKLFHSIDSDADGIIDHTQTWDYDNSGRIVLITADTDGDQEVDETTTVDYGTDHTATFTTVDFAGEIIGTEVHEYEINGGWFDLLEED